MPESNNLKCLRCGHEYAGVASGKSEPEERTCPKCRSNSVRVVKVSSGGPSGK